MLILVVGVNHRTAPVEVRERLSFSENRMGEWLVRINDDPDIEGCVMISTCNRTEIYAAVRDTEKGLQALTRFMSLKSGVEESEIKKYCFVYSSLQHTIRHLFKVTAGMDSMVLGETQILGQVRRAYQIACQHRTTNKLLNALFHKAITVGKRLRLETGIDKNPVSISYAAVELARQLYGNLQGKMVLVVGAGKMSELTVRHLLSNGVTGVIVSNRSYHRALEMAAKFNGHAVRFNELPDYMERADIVISCTAASHYVIRQRDVCNLLQRFEDKKLLLIDIAVPRDIEPSVAELEGVSLYDVDDLQNVVDHNLQEREKAASVGEGIVEQEMIRFMNWMSIQMVVPTIAALKELGEGIKQTELTRALNRLGPVTDYEHRVISSMASSIVNQLLHHPVTKLKEYNLSKDGQLYAQILHELFNLKVKDSCPSFRAKES